MRIMEKLRKKLVSFCWWIWQECKDGRTLALLLVVIAAVYSPVWGGFLLHRIFRWKWALAVATACMVFWAGPGTPFFPLCVAITLSIKKARQLRRDRRSRRKSGNEEDAR